MVIEFRICWHKMNRLVLCLVLDYSIAPSVTSNFTYWNVLSTPSPFLSLSPSPFPPPSPFLSPYPSPFPPTSSSSSVFRSKVDFTIFFRELAVAASQEDSNDALLVLEPSFYEPCFTKKVLVSRLISPFNCLYINVISPVPISYFVCVSVSVCLSTCLPVSSLV